MPRLARTKTAVRNSEHPSTTGRSRRPMARTIVFPRPGQANTYSVATAPPRSDAKLSPTTVTTGMRAFCRACRTKTRAAPAPLARAVRRKSAVPASTRLARVMRAIAPIDTRDSVTAGRTRWSHSGRRIEVRGITIPSMP